MSDDTERVWRAIESTDKRLTRVEEKLNVHDELRRRQDDYCQSDISKWAEVIKDMRQMSDRILTLELGTQQILRRLDTMTGLPWKLLAASAGIVAMLGGGWKLLVHLLNGSIKP